jgi:sphinganine-1-phosphate aldolase
MKEETIMTRMEEGAQESDKVTVNGSQVSGCIYTNDKKHWNFLSDAMWYHSIANPLFSEEFPAVGQFDAEIIKITLGLFNGPEGACGLTTSGGTESIIMAVLAYRQWARIEKGITKPNLVIA